MSEIVRGINNRPERHDLNPSEQTQPPDLPTAVTRHGRIVADLRFAQSVGEPVTPEQRAELTASRFALNAITPRGALDLETAFLVDRRLIREAADGRTDATARTMQLEAQMRDNPQLRADTFVQRWQALDRQRRLLLRDHEANRADKVAQTMVGMAKSLERDPQMESLLRTRKSELGLPAMPERSIGHSRADMIGRGRSRGPGIGM